MIGELVSKELLGYKEKEKLKVMTISRF